MIQELQLAGYSPEWSRVETESTFLDAASTLPDLIIAERGGSSLNGIRAVQVLRERKLEVPIILISDLPDESIAIAALEVGADEYVHRTQLGRLRLTVPRLLDHYRLRQKHKREVEKRHSVEDVLRNLTEHSLVGIQILQDGKYAFLNSKLAEIFGYSEAEIIALNSWTAVVAEVDRPMVLDQVRRRLSGEIPRAHYVFRGVRKDQKIIEIEIRSDRIELHGRPAVLGMLIDVTETRRAEQALRDAQSSLEQRVRDRTAELEAANKELEAFSYSVSHDLRAPLRAIDGFSRILLAEFASAMTEEARDYLESVRANTQQMGRLVDDLLAFSRLGRQSVKQELVKPTHLVRQCLEDLRGEQAGQRVDVVLEELPTCRADPSLLRQVWTNLLSNAFKYSRKREVSQIAVGSRTGDSPGKRTYFVQDNGVGFDMRYSHKLFGVFQRLHRAEDYQGTGVGLAIVQRIVHRHGGQVWAQAEPDRGATFYFTLEEGGSPDAGQ